MTHNNNGFNAMLTTAQKTETTVVLTMTNPTDYRECRLEGDYYVHVLHSAWRVHKDDPSIVRVLPKA